jgi:uncharacterized protein (TIGR02266 family)
VGDERRREPRESITLLVDYDGAADLVDDFTTNLSTGGTFVETDRQLPIGSPVRLVLSFPGLLRPIALEGVVRWHGPGGDQTHGLGIEFANLGEGGVHQEIQEIVGALRRGDAEVGKRRLRLLVVEDNPHVARLIQDGFAESSRFPDVTFEFEIARDGREALTALTGPPFDAAIVDMYMPVIDGAKLIAQIRADPRSRALPVLAVSAGGEAARADALAAGADLFLDKPMRLRQIIESMAALVGLRPR